MPGQPRKEEKKRLKPDFQIVLNIFPIRFSQMDLQTLAAQFRFPLSSTAIEM